MLPEKDMLEKVDPADRRRAASPAPLPAVLVVDDEPTVTASLRRLFHKEPWRILEAHSGEDALEIFGRESIDVIVTDEEMPGMSGCDLLARVRRQHPETVRMVLTGRASLDLVIRAVNEGEIYRFFLKPCQMEDLAVSIRQAVELKRLRDENQMLADTLHAQNLLLAEMERQNPGITLITRDSEGAIVIDED
jgi:two-component system, probable response regulator PhcQ